MGLLSQVFSKRALDMPDSWRVWGMGETPAGVDVTPSSAMQYSAVFACVRVLAEDVASLPLILYRRLDRGKARATDHPLHRILRYRGNDELTSMELRELLMSHALLWGNGYAEKEFNRAGGVRGLWPLRPDKMRVGRVDGRLVYEYRLPNGQMKYFDPVQIMHIRGLGGNGLTGFSPIALARNAVGLGLAAEEYGSRFFGNGAKPPLVLMYPGHLSKEGQDNLRQSWSSQTEGLSKSNRVAVLEEGVQVKEIGIPPEDAQFLQTRRFQALEIARIYRVPPHKIQDLERATFSNIEHQSIEYVSGTLQPWLVRWEQAIWRDLLTEQEQGAYFAEHLVDGLLRGDTLSRYQAYAMGRQNGWLSANDVRERENLNPIEGGDEYLSPLNMVAVGDGGDGERGSGGAEVRGSKGGQERRSVGTQRRELMAAHREVFLEVMGRAVRRETNDVRGGAEKFLGKRDSGSFQVWLVEFYREFEPWLIEALGPLYRSYAQVIAATAAAEIDGEAELLDVAVWSDVYLAELAERWVEKSRRKLDEALGVGSADVVEDELGAVLGALDGWREMWPVYLADREIVMAGNGAAVGTYQANGKTKLVWDTSGQPHVCDFCRSLDGTTIEISGDWNFEAEGLPSFRGVKWPPLHEKCECVVVAE